MFIPTIIMGVLAVVLFILAYKQGQNQHLEGLKLSLNMLWEILPMLIFAFIVAGMFQMLIPQELISKWVGKESGMNGIFFGTIAGALSPGGPFISFPIVVVLLHSGASIGTSVAFITSWALLAVTRLPMEAGILGWKFTLIRISSTLFFPPLAGVIAQILFGRFKL